MRLTLAALSCCFVMSAVPGAAIDPAYPEIVLPLPAAPDAELSSLLAAIEGDAGRWSRGEGDPSRIEDLLADSVTLLVGGVELEQDESFTVWAETGRAETLEKLGDLVSYDDGDRPTLRRRAADTIGSLLLDQFVGENPWMPGDICTNAFGKLPYADMKALMARNPSPISAWRVAALPSDKAEFHPPNGKVDWKAGQLVFIDADAPPIRSCCWQQVVMPDRSAAYVQMSFGRSGLRPYLNSHVCFGKENGAWRITKVAIRTP